MLEEARLVNKDGAIAVLGTYAKPLTRDNPGFVDGYRPATGKVKGWTIDPGKTAQIVFGLTLRRPGKYVFRGIELMYRVGHHRFSWQYPTSGTLCAPISRYGGRRIDRCAS